MLSICVNFCRSYAPFGTWNTGNTQFSAFFSYMLQLTYWAEILHLTLFYCTTDHFFKCCQFVSIFVGVMPLFELKIMEIQFSQFSPICFDILSQNIAYYFVFLYYRWSFVITLYPSGSLSVIPFSVRSSYTHWQIKLKFIIWHWFLKCVSFRKV